MINEVDKALRILVSSSAGCPEGLEVSFEPPNAKWVQSLNGSPTVNFHLYDIQGDIKGIQVGRTPVRNERNQIVGYRWPATWYRLSYVATAWSASRDPEEDHQMLGWMLYIFAALKTMPGSTLTGSLARIGIAAVEACRPTVDARPTPQSVAALGMARPYIELVITAPVVQEVEEAAGLVLEELVLEAQGFTGQPFERVQRRFTGGIAELEETDPGDPFVEKSRGGSED